MNKRIISRVTIDYDNVEQANWSILARQSQNGDKRAYSVLLGAISSYIRNYLVGGLANPDWADDITQDALISIHKALKTYSPDRPFKPWMMAIVSFRRTDFLRKHYGRHADKATSLDNPDFLSEHVTNPQHVGEYKDIEAALDNIPEKQRQIFTKMKIEGYTAKEIANELGMSESAVKVSAHRTANKLKDVLQ